MRLGLRLKLSSVRRRLRTLDALDRAPPGTRRLGPRARQPRARRLLLLLRVGLLALEPRLKELLELVLALLLNEDLLIGWG